MTAIRHPPSAIEDLSSVLATDPLASDAPRVRRVHQAIEEGTCWLAVTDGETVGYIVIDERLFDRPFIWLVIVRASSRRRAIGTALVHFAIGLFPSTCRWRGPARRPGSGIPRRCLTRRRCCPRGPSAAVR
jgi:hypothetical protein